MAYGDAENQGVTRGNKFYHKGLNLFVEFPQGWKIQNDAQAVAAISPAEDQAIVMQMESVSASGAGYAGIGTKDNQQQRVAMIPRGNQGIFISGVGKSQLPNQTFFNVAKSVRRLNGSEASLASGRKIRVITARAGDTVKSLAARSNLDSYAEAQIRLINDLYPNGEPTPGQLVKIIE